MKQKLLKPVLFASPVRFRVPIRRAHAGRPSTAIALVSNAALLALLAVAATPHSTAG